MSGAPRVPTALFVKAPEPGYAKTRLGAGIGHTHAAALYAAFVDDTLATLSRTAALDLAIWVARDADRSAFEGRGLPIVVQPSAPLGERMRVALEAGLARAPMALVIGSDAPTMSGRHVRGALERLESAPGDAAVFGPTPDGGYYLVGAKGRAPSFEGVRFSGAHALADSVRSAAAEGLEARLCRPHYDVDTADDLRLLRLELALLPEAAPATLAALRDADFDPADSP